MSYGHISRSSSIKDKMSFPNGVQLPLTVYGRANKWHLTTCTPRTMICTRIIMQASIETSYRKTTLMFTYMCKLLKI